MQRGDPMELDFEGLEMQKWNIKKRFIFCIFCWWQQKISSSFSKIFNGLWSYRSWEIEVRNIRKTAESLAYEVVT